MLKLIALCVAGSLGLAAVAMAASDQGQPQSPQQPTPPPPQMTADLKPGDMAPDFSLMGSDDKMHKLSDYRGKTVVVSWFPKAFTGG